MRIGPTPLDEADGAILMHALDAAGTLRKGTRLGAAEIARLRAAGFSAVPAARLEPGDVHEDEAAARLAAALAGPGVAVEAAATGRANLFADVAGLLEIDRAAVDAVNRLDPGITLATRADRRGVEAGRMVATVKIIPFSVPEAAVAAAEAEAAGRAVVAVRPWLPLRVAVISTLLPSLKPSTVEKTLKVLAARLAPAGAVIVADLRVAHQAGAVAAALASVEADLVVVFGASAITDAADVVPAGLAAAGGRTIHFGMPVDPGNLLLLGDLHGRPVLGAPGCARSPRENGFDFVLERLLAGADVTAADIVGMGVGGLLMDIVTRPAPRGGEARVEDRHRPVVAALVLAAGRSTRMGATNKLLAETSGVPMVRRAVEAALASAAASVTVVTGHMAGEVEAALAGLPVAFARNPDFADGLSTSLKAGIAAVPAEAEAAVVLLADMPDVSPDLIDRLIAAYDPAAGALIAVPVTEGRRGNPVLWSRRFFADLSAVTGDVGARAVIAANPDAVVEVAAGAEAALDLDTPQALEAWRAARPVR